MFAILITNVSPTIKSLYSHIIEIAITCFDVKINLIVSSHDFLVFAYNDKLVMVLWGHTILISLIVTIIQS